MFEAEIAIQDSERSWNHIGALLGAMIELFLKHFGCSSENCGDDQQGYGNTGYGEAWQDVAYVLENSLLLRAMKYKFFQPTQDLGFYRREMYVLELSTWKEPKKRIVADLRLLEAWTGAADRRWILRLVREVKKKGEGRA